MVARIYRPAKSAMQSGLATTKQWVLEFEPAAARTVEPLMGWTSTTDMSAMVRLEFDSKEAAIAYAERNGIAIHARRAEAAQACAEVVCGQFPLRPSGPLDTLSARSVPSRIPPA